MEMRSVPFWCIFGMSAGNEALEIARMLINFRFGKFENSICPICSKGHAEFFLQFWHITFATNKTYLSA